MALEEDITIMDEVTKDKDKDKKEGEDKDRVSLIFSCNCK